LNDALSVSHTKGSTSSCNANKSTHIFVPKRTKGFEKKIKAANLESRLIPTREAASCIGLAPELSVQVHTSALC
jgi:hypothetical protein